MVSLLPGCLRFLLHLGGLVVHRQDPLLRARVQMREIALVLAK